MASILGCILVAELRPPGAFQLYGLDSWVHFSHRIVPQSGGRVGGHGGRSSVKYGDEDGCGAAYMISGLEAEGRARTLDELTEVPSPLGHLAGGGGSLVSSAAGGCWRLAAGSVYYRSFGTRQARLPVLVSRRMRIEPTTTGLLCSAHR